MFDSKKVKDLRRRTAEAGLVFHMGPPSEIRVPFFRPFYDFPHFLVHFILFPHFSVVFLGISRYSPINYYTYYFFTTEKTTEKTRKYNKLNKNSKIIERVGGVKN
jgi:hypothetical protein